MPRDSFSSEDARYGDVSSSAIPQVGWILINLLYLLGLLLFVSLVAVSGKSWYFLC